MRTFLRASGLIILMLASIVLAFRLIYFVYLHWYIDTELLARVGRNKRLLLQHAARQSLLLAVTLVLGAGFTAALCHFWKKRG